MNFRPCIDLHGGKVKQIVGGTLTDASQGLVENFVSDKDAAYYGELFKKDGLSGGHVIMLGPGNESEAGKALRAFPGGLQIGGGMTPENAPGYFALGASHVIVTSYIFDNGAINYRKLERMVAVTGRNRLVLDLSCRKKDGVYYVVADRWQKFTNFAITRENLLHLAGFCDEFLIHGVDAEGKRQGILEDLVEFLGSAVTVPTTYAGGVRTLEDLALVDRLGRGRIDLTIGSALDIFGGNLSYREVLKQFLPAP
jgi:phosphoribosylformimino-5-aminoimidazole carboxamide ribotide isomerase